MHKIMISLTLVVLLLAGCKSLNQGTTVTPEKATQQEDEFYQQNYFRYHDYVYQDNIKTVTLHKAGFALSMPIIRLGSSEQLMLTFDDLDADVKNYRYEIIHCDADWKRSALTKMQYNKGYEDGLIEDYEFSFNTMEDFTHYTLKFPKQGEVTPMVSGNYILKVYESGRRNQSILTRRFMVYEPKVKIVAEVNPALPADKRQTHQEIDFSIKLGNYYVADPAGNLKVMIMQNMRWDNMITNIKPRFIRPKELDYDYEGKLIFSGLHEFRFFDTRSLKHQVPGIHKIYYDSLGNHVVLNADKPRPYGSYVSLDDINGSYYIISYDVNRQKELEADYTWVHFFMPYNAPLLDGNVYVMGELSKWQFLDKAKMTYNYKAKGYQASMYLKQGYYNYHYVFLPNNSDTGDASMFEGQHYETENNYTIFVYHRPGGENYDKLIAAERVNSEIEE